MTPVTKIELQLPQEIYQRLQAEADRRQAAIDEVVRQAIDQYIDSLDEEFEDTPDEKIEADLRQALQEAMTGQTVPAREALEVLRKTQKQSYDQG